MPVPRLRAGPPAAPPITFTVDDESYVLPELGSRVWLEALVLEPPGCWLRIVPAELAGAGPENLTGRLFDPEDPFDLDDLELAAEHVVGEACGVDLYPACRLAASAWANWLGFDAWCCSNGGFDPIAAPVGRVLAAVWGWRLSLCQQKTDLARLEGEIWVPPPATTASGRPRDQTPVSWSDEAEAAAFEATMANWGRQGSHHSG